MKKLFYCGIAAALVALAAVNLNLSMKPDRTVSDVTLVQVEAQAFSWNEFLESVQNILQGQGATKDEREISEQCPCEQSSSGSGSVSGSSGGNGASASGSGSSSQTNPETRTDIRCAYGSENCTPVKC